MQDNRKERYKKVAYYPGCALEGSGQPYDISTRAVGKKLGLTIRAVEMDDPLASVDVDKQADHELVTAILKGEK